MVLTAIFIVAGIYCAFITWRLWEDPPDYNIDPDGVYCICDYDKASDGSVGLCGSELDPNDPDIPFKKIPSHLNCSECLRIEQIKNKP